MASMFLKEEKNLLQNKKGLFWKDLKGFNMRYLSLSKKNFFMVEPRDYLNY